jgi:lipopolysaccharide export system permease protein
LAFTLTILKFEKQNELIILWTSGLNKIKLVNLFFFVSLIVLLIQLSFAVFITPNSLNKSRALIRSSNFDSMPSVIKINSFSDSFKNLTFYVEKKNNDSEMENIFIRDENNTFKNIVEDSESSTNTTIIAQKGFLDGKKIILSNGLIQTQNQNGKLNNVTFSRTELKLDTLTPRTITKPKLQETSSSSLLKCLFRKKENFDNEKIVNCPKHNMDKDIISTLLRRVGMPIYIPLITLICSFILISNRKTKSRDKYFYFALSFTILILAEILVRFSGFSKLHGMSYFFFPIILIPITYLILSKKINNEKRKSQ